MSRISKLLSRNSNPVEFKQPKLFVPVDCQIPETPKTIMARTMLQSGLITKDEYEKMLGVSFDISDEREEDFDNFEDWEDDFKLSSFSEYEEFLDVKEEQEQQTGALDQSAQPDQTVEHSENTDGTEAE